MSVATLRHFPPPREIGRVPESVGRALDQETRPSGRIRASTVRRNRTFAFFDLRAFIDADERDALSLPIL